MYCLYVGFLYLDSTRVDGAAELDERRPLTQRLKKLMFLGVISIIYCLLNSFIEVHIKSFNVLIYVWPSPLFYFVCNILNVLVVQVQTRKSAFMSFQVLVSARPACRDIRGNSMRLAIILCFISNAFQIPFEFHFQIQNYC